VKYIIIILTLIGFYFTKYVHTQTRIQADIRVTFKTSEIARRSGSSRIPNRKIPPKVTNTKSVGIYKAKVLDWQKPVAEKIRAKFGEDGETAVAIFRAESGLRASAQGWNCSYGVCNVEDRPNAISTDCGTAQINIKGTECPSELFDEEKNIERAYSMYKRRGFQPWSVFNSGKYLTFLTK